MDYFYDKIDYKIEDILQLIENEIEESIYLDFKEASALDKSDGKKKDISKDVSSFANSDGGIIIYGIKEQNHKASSLSYINGQVYTKEWLEQLINSTIHRRISDIKIYPIRNNGNIEETIYIVKIPKSIDTPHLSKDKRYYKRFNFESVPMEEYEIRQLYGRKIKSKLSIDNWSIIRTNKADNEGNKLTFEIEVTIYNDGDIMEKNYKVNLYFINFNKHLNLNWEPQISNYSYTWFDNGRVKVSSVASPVPIYPNETVNVLRINLEIQNDFFLETFKNLKYEAILLYSNGEDKIEGDFKGIVDKILNPDSGKES